MGPTALLTIWRKSCCWFLSASKSHSSRPGLNLQILGRMASMLPLYHQGQQPLHCWSPPEGDPEASLYFKLFLWYEACTRAEGDHLYNIMSCSCCHTSYRVIIFYLWTVFSNREGGVLVGIKNMPAVYKYGRAWHACQPGLWGEKPAHFVALQSSHLFWTHCRTAWHECIHWNKIYCWRRIKQRQGISQKKRNSLVSKKITQCKEIYIMLQIPL